MRILLAEDEAISRQALVKTILQSNPDYVVKEAGDGEKAKSILNEECFDLVIADIRMPSLDGLSLGRWIKENYPNTEIAYLSGYAQFDYAVEAVHLGAIEYLLKPIEERKLIALLEKVQAKTNTTSDKIVDTINTYIRNCTESRIKIAELCQSVLFLNPSYVSRYYHQVTGHTIAWAIKDAKLTLAAKYLKESNMNISDISSRCGYQSVSSFIQSFSKKYSVSPSVYRQSIRGKVTVSECRIGVLQIEDEDIDNI